jgi:hypothetical protein
MMHPAIMGYLAIFECNYSAKSIAETAAYLRIGPGLLFSGTVLLCRLFYRDGWNVRWWNNGCPETDSKPGKHEGSKADFSSQMELYWHYAIMARKLLKFFYEMENNGKKFRKNPDRGR